MSSQHFDRSPPHASRSERGLVTHSPGYDDLLLLPCDVDLRPVELIAAAAGVATADSKLVPR